jgi:hypothetical protein
MPQNTASFTVEDFDRETSNTGVNVGPLTAANFTAKRNAIDALKLTIPGIITGEIRRTRINEVFAESAANVTSPLAQREAKWLVTLRDNTQFFDVGNTINNPGFGNTFDIEVPTADLSLLENNNEELDLTVPAVAAYVTALEAIAHSPTGGNECIVVSIKNVGRNI